MSWRVCLKEEKNKALKFFTEMDDEIDPPISTLSKGIEGTIDLFFERGKILVTEQKDKFVGLVGYLIGEPSKKYKNPKIGYVYSLVLHPDYRNNFSIAINFFKTLVIEMEKDGFEEIRFKAYHKNKSLNKLYSKIAFPLREEVNDQGKIAILYSIPLKKLKEKYIIK